MRILSYQQLKSEKGIPYSRATLDHLEKAKKFPQRVRIGEGPTGAIGWIESEVDELLGEKAAARST